jgi:uncharacterized protein
LGNKVIAATAVSEIYPTRDLEEARAFTRERGIEHIFFESEEMALSDFLSNKPDRCYHCKILLFEQMKKIAAERSLKNIAHGANADDAEDYRPGLKAAEEMGVLAPLLASGLNKDDVRRLSKEMGLSQWNKPSMACLATRIPYGTPITREDLKMIERAETVLSEIGIQQYRVRHHGSVARIEVDPAGQKMLMDDRLRREIVDKFKDIGFLHVALDLEGYVSGSMNKGLALEKSKGSERDDGRVE